MGQPTVALRGLLDRSRCVDLAARDRDRAVAEICAVAAKAPGVGDPEALLRAVLEREGLLSTGIGLGIAVPHARIHSVRDFALALGRSRAGIPWDSLDGQPVRLVLLIAGPEDGQSRYLRLLAEATLRLKRAEVREALLAAPDAGSMADLLAGTRA